MNEATLNAASTVTSTGSGWFSSLLNAAGNAGAAYLNRNNQAAGLPAAPVVPSQPTNWKPIAMIGGGVALLIVLVFAFRK